MLSAYSDDRPSPVVGALGAATLLMLVAGLVLVFTRSTDTSVPGASNVGPGKIVFASDRSDDFEIYVFNADGSGRARLTKNPAKETFPAWSPDGSKIAFESDRDGDTEIYVMNADGTNQTRLTNSPTADVFPRWSPDGSRFVFSSARDRNFEIYVMDERPHRRTQPLCETRKAVRPRLQALRALQASGASPCRRSDLVEPSSATSHQNASSPLRRVGPLYQPICPL